MIEKINQSREEKRKKKERKGEERKKKFIIAFVTVVLFTYTKLFGI